jgi:hypothetical protein
MRIELDIVRDSDNTYPKGVVKFEYYKGNTIISIIINDRKIDINATELLDFFKLTSK